MVASLIGWSAVSRTAAPALAATSTFTDNADANVSTSAPNKNTGKATTLQVRAPKPEYWTYLRFTVAGLTDAATGAKLRLYTTDASPVGGSVFAVTASWTETTLTWNNKPALGAPVGTIGPVAVNSWVDVTLPASTFTADGTYSVAITSTST